MDFVFDPLTPNTANCGPGMGFYALGNAVALTLGGRQYGATAFVESNNGAANCIPTGGEVEMRLAWGAPTIVDAALAAQYPALWTTVGPGGFQFTLDDWMRLPHADQLGGLPTTLNPNPFPTTVHIFNGSTNQRLNIDGQLTDGQLTAVPEPTSLVLFGTGSALLLARRRRH